MLVNTERLVMDPTDPTCFQLYAKEENKRIFRAEAEVWTLITDLPQRIFFGHLGEIEPGTMAAQVRLYETSVSYVSNTVSDLRREFSPLIVEPNEYRRILRVAWACDEPIKLEPISIKKAYQLSDPTGRTPLPEVASKRYPRLAPPSAPAQPLAFRRTLQDHPVKRIRFWLARWESPPVL